MIRSCHYNRFPGESCHYLIKSCHYLTRSSPVTIWSQVSPGPHTTDQVLSLSDQVLALIQQKQSQVSPVTIWSSPVIIWSSPVTIWSSPGPHTTETIPGESCHYMIRSWPSYNRNSPRWVLSLSDQVLSLSDQVLALTQQKLSQVSPVTIWSSPGPHTTETIPGESCHYLIKSWPSPGPHNRNNPRWVLSLSDQVLSLYSSPGPHTTETVPGESCHYLIRSWPSHNRNSPRWVLSLSDQGPGPHTTETIPGESCHYLIKSCHSHNRNNPRWVLSLSDQVLALIQQKQCPRWVLSLSDQVLALTQQKQSQVSPVTIWSSPGPHTTETVPGESCHYLIKSWPSHNRNSPRWLIDDRLIGIQKEKKTPKWVLCQFSFVSFEYGADIDTERLLVFLFFSFAYEFYIYQVVAFLGYHFSLPKPFYSNW